MRFLSLLTLLACIPSFSATAEKLAITGAEIHTMSKMGVVDSGTVLVEDGKIVQVLDSVTVPNGYEQVDATDKVITPGFIGAYTNLGLVEVSSSAGVVDHSVDGHSLSNVGAAFDAQYAFNPDSTLIDITRIEGFTSAITGLSRTGMLYNGQGAVVSLNNSFDSIIKPHAYLHMDVSNTGANRNGESRAALWVALRVSLDEAMLIDNMNKLSKFQHWDGMISRTDAAPLMKVVRGQMPLLVTANRASDILQVLALQKEYPDLNLVLVSASDGWRVAREIAQAGVPVILNPESNLPGGFDRLGSTLENAARLHEAGVTIAIGMNTHNIRLAPQHAGNAVANGLPHAAGIAALTINPASIFGVNDKVGSIETGKQADLVIWSGDPLEVTQAAEQVFIAGQAMKMESRQTKLRDRYLNRDTSKPVAYSN